MKTHRNKFWRIAIVLTAAILLLLLVVYGYFSWRKYNAFKDAVHADAALIIKIDADQLYFKLAMDYLGNPSYYNEQAKKSTESGLNIPAQVFIYTVKSKSAQAYFCTLPVADLQALKIFLRKKMGITAFRDMGRYVSGTSADGRLTVAYNAHTFTAGYALNKENVADIIVDLLERKNLLSDQDPRMTRLKALDQDLAYIAGAHTGTGEFRDGSLHIEGDFNLKGTTIKEGILRHRVFDSNAVVKMWLSAQPALNTGHKEIRIKDHVVNPDSLLKYCNGYFDLELGNPVSQTDTVVTYEYDDDFEKEAVLAPRVVKVPGINSVVAGNAAGLLSYLKKADLVQGLTLNKDVFPLYKVYFHTDRSSMVLGTAKSQLASALKELTPYFFYLEADLVRLKAQGLIPLFGHYTGQATRLLVKAKRKGDDKNHFTIDLYFKRKDINALGQLR